jgi:hypothetical protein
MPRPVRPVSLPRLAAVPPAEPPYDDERRPGDPVEPAVRADAPATQGALALAYVPRADPRVPGAPGSLPDERRLRSLGQAVAEILAGRRPPATVSDRFTERAHAELVRAGKMIDTRRPPLVGVPHVKQPRDGAVEMCLLVHCGERSHVLALRLERQGVQWLCTDFETA